MYEDLEDLNENAFQLVSCYKKMYNILFYKIEIIKQYNWNFYVICLEHVFV